MPDLFFNWFFEIGLVQNFASDVMQGTPAYLSAVGEVVVDHTRCAINNPLPVIAGVALTAVSLELAVAVLVTDLLVNGKVHLNEQYF